MPTSSCAAQTPPCTQSSAADVTPARPSAPATTEHLLGERRNREPPAPSSHPLGVRRAEALPEPARLWSDGPAGAPEPLRLRGLPARVPGAVLNGFPRRVHPAPGRGATALEVTQAFREAAVAPRVPRQRA